MNKEPNAELVKEQQIKLVLLTARQNVIVYRAQAAWATIKGMEADNAMQSHLRMPPDWTEQFYTCSQELEACADKLESLLEEFDAE